MEDKKEKLQSTNINWSITTLSNTSESTEK